jgi:hypothetical protein
MFGRESSLGMTEGQYGRAIESRSQPTRCWAAATAGQTLRYDKGANNHAL